MKYLTYQPKLMQCVSVGKNRRGTGKLIFSQTYPSGSVTILGVIYRLRLGINKLKTREYGKPGSYCEETGPTPNSLRVSMKKKILLVIAYIFRNITKIIPKSFVFFYIYIFLECDKKSREHLWRGYKYWQYSIK